MEYSYNDFVISLLILCVLSLGLLFLLSPTPTHHFMSPISPFFPWPSNFYYVPITEFDFV